MTPPIPQFRFSIADCENRSRSCLTPLSQPRGKDRYAVLRLAIVKGCELLSRLEVGKGGLPPLRLVEIHCFRSSAGASHPTSILRSYWAATERPASLVSFVSQRHHRIHFGRVARGHVTRHKRHRQENKRDRYERHRIGRAYPVK